MSDASTRARIEERLAHSDFATVQQGVELLLSLDDPTLLRSLVEGCRLDDERLITGPALPQTRFDYQEWLTLRLMIAAGRLDQAHALTLGRALHGYDLSALGALPTLQIVRVEQDSYLSDFGGLKTLPRSLPCFDACRLPLSVRKLETLMAVLPPSCETLIGEQVLWNTNREGILARYPNLRPQPFVLPEEWSGSRFNSYDDIEMTMTLHPEGNGGGRIHLHEHEDGNHGSTSENFNGRFSFNRAERTIQLHFETKSHHQQYPCARTPCEGQIQQSFAATLSCSARDCGRLPAGWFEVDGFQPFTLTIDLVWDGDCFVLETPDFYLSGDD